MEKGPLHRTGDMKISEIIAHLRTHLDELRKDDTQTRQRLLDEIAAYSSLPQDQTLTQIVDNIVSHDDD